MTMGTSSAVGSPGVSQTLRRAVESTQQLDEAIYLARRSLEKRGIQLSAEITEIVKEIRTRLMQFQQESEHIVRQFDLLQHLVRSTAAITSSLDLDRVLDLVMDNVIDLTKAERAYLMLVEGDRDELVICKARNWDNRALPDTEIDFSRSVITIALEKGEPIVTTNAQNDSRFQGIESIIAQGLRSILCIPLILDGKIVGVLYTDTRMREGLFSQDVVPVLAAFGTQAAIAIEKARLHHEELHMQRLERELNVAQQIQMSMLPKIHPTYAGWDFAALYEPARIVGGDFYDFFELPDGRLGIVVADVADKGIPAAIFMALSRTTIRATALPCCTPAEALLATNRVILQETHSNMFLTVFYTLLDPATGNLMYANGGHNRPVVWRAESQSFEELRAPGVIIGALDGIRIENRECSLASGDIAVFYTDGVTEAMNADLEEFGETRMRTVIAEHVHESAQAIVDALMCAVAEFEGLAPRSDDVTIVVLRRL